MILLAGGFAIGGGQVLNSTDLIWGELGMLVLVGVLTSVALMLLWGGVNWWVEQICRDQVRVRPDPERCSVCGSCGMESWCSRLECPGPRPGA
jgi:hypothetical protein